MKLKKVEISAFRIYDNPEDATFDLIAKSGEAAAFVSLFAPNGFGKTSFYDAIEYAVTESVDRFYLRAEELEKLANVQSLDKFIRNTNSDRNTYVKLLTDNASTPIIDRPFYKHGNQKHDLNLDRSRRKIHPFQKVMLSQEWISAFLTESDGETRYKKFMTNPELTNVDNYYNNLKHLLKALANRKNELANQVKQYEAEIKSLESENILASVNSQIDFLIVDLKENLLQRLTLNTTREEIKNLQDEISNRIVSSNRQEVLQQQQLEQLGTARSGDVSIVGAIQFFDLLDSRNSILEGLDIINTRLARFLKMEENRISVENKVKIRDLEIESRSVLQTVTKYLDEYVRLSREKEAKETNKKALQFEHQNYVSQTEQLNRGLIDAQTVSNGVAAQLEANALIKSELPEISRQIANLGTELSEKTNEVTTQRILLESKNKELLELSEKSSQLNRILFEIENKHYASVADLDSVSLTSLIQEIKELESELSKIGGELVSIDKAIQDQSILNDSITQLIELGIRIVNDGNRSSCPLCEAEYNSYDELISKITNNNALNDSSKFLLESKSNADRRSADVVNRLSVNKGILSQHFQERLNILTERASNLESEITTLNISIQGSDALLEPLKEKIGLQRALTRNLSIEEFEQIIDTENRDLSNRLQNINGTLNQIRINLSLNTEMIDSISRRVDLISEEIQYLTENIQYQYVLSWLSQSTVDDVLHKDKLFEYEGVITTKIQSLNVEIAQTEEKIKNEELALSIFAENSLLAEKADLEKTIQEIDSSTNRYIDFLSDNFSIHTSSFDRISLLEELERQRLAINSKLVSNRRLIDEYQKLDLYCQNVWSFLQSEASRLKAENAKNDLNFLTANVQPKLEQEYNAARNYLELRVKNFFHVDLINQIYRKIDPHPDFKSVEFKTSFDVDNSRLDVFVRKTNDENLLVPNLYFSTAQINILSLSIFLASALKQTEYKCIFIDDPIQSMDSINVLSTIDLLRSIAVNEGRQIILSTHDENFHNLLKKKMPPELFDSKFLELKSFGKVM